MTNLPNTDGVLPMTFDDEIAAWRRRACKALDARPQESRAGDPIELEESLLDEAVALMRRALRHVPEDASAGVVVPEEVRAWAEAIKDVGRAARIEMDRRVANWILSLPAAPQPEPALSESCKAPSGQCVMVASTDGSWCPAGCVPATGRYSWRNARGVLAAPQPPSDELRQLRTIIEENHNGYGETGRALGWKRPISHVQGLRELLHERHELNAAEQALKAQPPERSAAQALTGAERKELRETVHDYLNWSSRFTSAMRALLARLGGEGQGGQAS